MRYDAEVAALLPLTLMALVAVILGWVAHAGRAVPSPTPMREVRDGVVEVAGRVVAEGHLRAPISGRPAAAWELVVERERGMFSWSPVVIRSGSEPLTLEDGSGRVHIEATPSQLRVHGPALTGRAGPFRAPPQAVLRVLVAQGCDPRGVIFCRGFRWYERVVSPGDEIRVRGVAQWTSQGLKGASARPARTAPGYRGMPVRAVLRAEAGASLHLRPTSQPSHGSGA